MEANWPALILLLFVTGIAVYIGRLWFKRWFNPLSLYSAIWGFCLCNYELRLIQYEPISRLAWCYIAIAWVFLYLGAATAISVTDSGSTDNRSIRISADLEKVRKGILVLVLVSIIALVDQLRAIQKEFGNPLVAIFVNSNDIYASRISNEISWLPYAGSCVYAACALAGLYTARIGKVTLVAISAIVVAAIQNTSGMGRTGLGIAAIFFMVPYVYAPQRKVLFLRRWKRNLAVALAAVILLAGFVTVSSIRGLQVDFPGNTPELDVISSYVPIFPSLYSNFSATPVAFSLYLSAPEENHVGTWGMYTFAPILRLLSRLGFPTKVPAYEENYYTPVPMNTDTYLKNIHSDFGPTGILLFPFTLGALSTFLVRRMTSKPTLTGLMVLSSLYVIIGFSFAFNLMLLGDWYIATFSAVLVSFFVRDRRVPAAGLQSAVLPVQQRPSQTF
jgi:oligosaccharide repeat unit polymerase